MQFLHSLHFTWKTIAQLLGISESTCEIEQFTCISGNHIEMHKAVYVVGISHLI